MDAAEQYQIELETNGGPVSLRPSDTYEGYELIERGGPFAIYSPEVNDALGRTQLPLERRHETFEPPAKARELLPFLTQIKADQGTIVYNDPKVRLISDLTLAHVQAGAPVEVQPTSYFNGLCTNDITCRKIYKGDELIYDGLEFMSRDGVVRDFVDSDCSNHVGSCTIAITNDGKFVIPAQSLRAAQYPGMLMPSGSGSADVVDLDHSSTLQELMIRSMERELLEETGLEPYRTDLVETKLLGYARLLERGGKPDFFGISLLKVPFYAVSSNTMTALRVDLPRISSDREDLPRLLASLAGMREGNRGLISTSLYLNLLLLEDYLERHADEFLLWLAAFEQEAEAEPVPDLF